MSKATITFEDVVVDGIPQVSMSLFLEGGFNKDSHAHQHAGICLKHLDSIAGMKTDEAVKWVDGAYIPQGGEAPAEEGDLQLDGANGLRLVKG